MSLNEPITTTFHLDESDRKEAAGSSLSVERSFNHSVDRPTTPSITEPTLPPVSSRSQPLGFDSDNHSLNQPTFKKARSSLGRVVQSFQFAMHACQQGDNQTNGQIQPINNQILMNPDDPQSIKQTIEAFRSLPSIYQACMYEYCLQAQQNRTVDNLLDSLVDCLTEYFLDCSTGQPDDLICQWLYETYLSGSQNIAVTPSSSNQPISQSVSPSVLFVLHLVPILVYSLIYRVSRSINCAGLSAVLLAIYNTHRSKSNLSLNQSINQSIGLSCISGAPLVDTAKFARNPYGATNFTPGPSINQSPSPSLNHSTNFRPLTSLDLESVSVLSAVVLSVFVSRMSLMNRICAQQFCALSIKLVSSSESDEVLSQSVGQSLNEPTESSLLNWKHNQGESINHRYNLSNDLLQVIVVGLTYCLTGFPAAQSMHHPNNQFNDMFGVQNLALISLRGVHCRAVEELLPEILLQTTPLLEAVEE